MSIFVLSNAIIYFRRVVCAGDYYNEAGEKAMEAMKGRLANKYYALSEEAYAMVEEWQITCPSRYKQYRFDKWNTIEDLGRMKMRALQAVASMW